MRGLKSHATCDLAEEEEFANVICVGLNVSSVIASSLGLHSYGSLVASQSDRCKVCKSMAAIMLCELLYNVLPILPY